RVFAISVQVRSSTADVFGPRSSGNSRVARLNRPSALVCHTKRKGRRGGCVSDDVGSDVFGTLVVASESTRDASAAFAKTASNVDVDPAPSLSILICPTEISPSEASL